MKNYLSFLFLLSFSPFLLAVEKQTISEEQCRAASTQVITISEEALAKSESKKNAAKLKKLINDWNARLKSDEKACDVYQSILKSSTSF